LYKNGSSGAAILLGTLIGQVVGNALYEEVTYRAFFFPQLYLKLRGTTSRSWTALITALLISQILFALHHLPNQLFIQGMTLGGVALSLPFLAGYGILMALIYVRTHNIFICVGLHALTDAPTSLFVNALPQMRLGLLSNVSASGLFWLSAILFLLLWPLFTRRRSTQKPTACASFP
jgi:membrane protease YdiL (CAAX protease family)